MNNKVELAKKLVNEIEEFLTNIRNYSLVIYNLKDTHKIEGDIPLPLISFKGIDKLTQADLSRTVMYLTNFIKSNGNDFGKCMNPIDRIRDVLIVNGVIE